MAHESVDADDLILSQKIMDLPRNSVSRFRFAVARGSVMNACFPRGRETARPRGVDCHAISALSRAFAGGRAKDRVRVGVVVAKTARASLISVGYAGHWLN